MNALTPVRPSNPAELGWPATLPLEVALRTAPIRSICEAYGITKESWEALRANEQFIAQVKVHHETLQKEGMSFKLKARMQAEELLKNSWRLIDDPSGEVPPSVKADLIKATWRIAGFEPSKTDAGPGPQNALQININLG